MFNYIKNTLFGNYYPDANRQEQINSLLEQSRELELKKKIPVLETLTRELGAENVLVGGSRALSIWSGDKSWTPSDDDVFISLPENENSNPFTTTLEPSRDLLSRILGVYPYQLNIKLSRDSPHQSLVSPENTENEDFDKAILGTVNTVDKSSGKKLQFVIVSPKLKNFENIHQWYKNTSDLPTCYVNGKFEFNGSLLEEQKCLYQKVLPAHQHPRHQNRVQKYQERGFTW